MDTPHNETYERLLDVAEELFSRRGYAAVRLRDITAEIGIKHAAIYYYLKPGEGKEELYMRVMERSFQRHHDGVAAAIAAAGDDLAAGMRAVAGWFLERPAINIALLEQADFTALSKANSQHLNNLMFDALRLPVEEMLIRAQAQGLTNLPDPGLAAISFVSLVQTIHLIPSGEIAEEKVQIVEAVIHMLLNGWLRR